MPGLDNFSILPVRRDACKGLHSALPGFLYLTLTTKYPVSVLKSEPIKCGTVLFLARLPSQNQRADRIPVTIGFPPSPAVCTM